MSTEQPQSMMYDLDPGAMQGLRMRKFCAIDKLQVGVDKVVYETGPNCYGRGEVVSVSPAMFARRTRLVLDYGPELGGLKVVEHNATDQVAIHDPQPDDPLC